MFLRAATPSLPLRPRPIITALSTVSSSSSSPSSASSSSTSRCCAARATNSHALTRRYATTSRPSDSSSSSSSSSSDGLPPWPSTPNPTPYDVLGVPRKGPYTKKRFYQLVKLYHPDIHTAQQTRAAPSTTPGRRGHAVSPALRLERYHLIVAANDLLSDPERRRQYDTYGAGWAGSSAADELRARDRSWRDRPGNAAMNATWEDWERWHAANQRRQDAHHHQHQEGHGQEKHEGQPPGGPPGGFYMPNSVFAALIALLCTVGALAQGRRAESSAAHYMDVTAQRHQNVSEDVMRSASANRGLSQEERVARFLRDRESVAWQYEQPARYRDDDGHDRTRYR